MKIVICPNCQIENRGSRLSCENCGASLLEVERIERPEAVTSDAPTTSELFAEKSSVHSDVRVKSGSQIQKKDTGIKSVLQNMFVLTITLVYAFIITLPNLVFGLLFVAGVVAGVLFSLWSRKYPRLKQPEREERYRFSDMPGCIAIPTGMICLVIYLLVQEFGESLAISFFGDYALPRIAQILEILTMFGAGFFAVSSAMSLLSWIRERRGTLQQ